MEDTKRAKWIAVLVLVVAGGLFGRSMARQIIEDDDRAVAVNPKEVETISTGGLYELHTRCARDCRDRGDLPGATWHERILARLRGEQVDESVSLDDADQDAPPAPQRSLEDPTHPGRTTAQADTDGLLSH
jgi:hypothetical protein